MLNHYRDALSLRTGAAAPGALSRQIEHRHHYFFFERRPAAQTASGGDLYRVVDRGICTLATMPPPAKTHRVFGQATRYQRQFGGGGRGGMGKSHSRIRTDTEDNHQKNGVDEETAAQRRRAARQQAERVEKGLGVKPLPDGATERGWLYNVVSTTVRVRMDDFVGSVFSMKCNSFLSHPTLGHLCKQVEVHQTDDAASTPERAGVQLFLHTVSGTVVTTTLLYRPYFYVVPALELTTAQLTTWCDTWRRLYPDLHAAELEKRLDLDQPNHLSPQHKEGRPVVKLVFDNVSQLVAVREDVLKQFQKNKKNKQQQQLEQQQAATNALFDNNASTTSSAAVLSTPWPYLEHVREYDVPYVVRVCTDLDIRAGTWYTIHQPLPVDGQRVNPTLSDADRETKAQPTVLAFDIECTKAPLKFPSAETDSIFMISYLVTTPTGPQGYLIVNRQVVSQDLDPFEYTPMPAYPGNFTIFNEVDEKALLQRFFEDYRRHAPQVVVTYNGDFFDWPFVAQRARLYGLNIWEETGVRQIAEHFTGNAVVHLDAFHWVQRDSYLPQGAQGLKAVTKYKLGYDPVEVDPEDMVQMAETNPVHMATYSVSDAVATYYLYEKYVHLFIFSLCTIIPMGPEDVLRKGSGTLCESLLMVQACSKHILCPNKDEETPTKFYKGHLLESETYIGGKVECLETGVYRSDVEYQFSLKPSACQHLIDCVDRDLTFAIEVEGGLNRKDIVNYDEVRSQIIEKLELLRDKPNRVEKPFIYHLDVGAMYPNIILSNRLQPSAIVDDATCAACDYNQSRYGCKRPMEWTWRGEYSPATRGEYERTKDQLAREGVALANAEDGDATDFNAMTERQQAGQVAARLKTYTKRAYQKTKVTHEESRTNIVCMRENDFYVDTVRQFRDRRYEYKKLNKKWKGKVAAAPDAVSKKECEDKVMVYDSLQVAHKCILNSFYGYVMRKGARWRSMEMAGIVTKTGADIITQARKLVEQIGRPLELDTDGIWCILPHSFPENYTFFTKDGSKLKLEYPCAMLNADVHDKFTNHQYQTLVDPDRGIYETRSECSIYFEVDGPYRAMILPASTEEGKLLKKRYAVFNFDGSLAELKGFELKRRGELELIKTFQSQVFERFLDGNSLKECYEAVADVANHWIDVLDTRGESLSDEELIDLISENRSMSRQLEDYGDQKGTSQTTARRLGEFLGTEYIKDKGLNCKFVIAEQPYGAPVTDRAIPTNIWKTEPQVMKHFLRKWLKSPGLEDDGLDIRNVVDWDYYMDRFANTIRKIITIPAALQRIPNPVPRVEHPDWLLSKVAQLNDRFQQRTIDDMFAPLVKSTKQAKRAPSVTDIEDVGGSAERHGRSSSTQSYRNVRQRAVLEHEDKKGPRVKLTAGNFDSWLKQKKAVWRRARKDRKEAQRSDPDAVAKRRRKNGNLESFVRDAAKTLSAKEWHVLEIREMTGYDSTTQSQLQESGEFVVWAMIGNDSLQKIHVTVPRIVYVSTLCEIEGDLSVFGGFRRVDRHLPHNKRAKYVYEISMPEYVYRSSDWLSKITPKRKQDEGSQIFESIYESSVPLQARILAQLGSVVRLTPEAAKGKFRKKFNVEEVRRIEKPESGEYLNKLISYRRAFLYTRLHPTMKMGVVILYVMGRGSGSFRSTEGGDEGSIEEDPTRPFQSEKGSFDFSAQCHVWIVKPRSKGRSLEAQSVRNINLQQCGNLLSQLLDTVQQAAGDDSDYACVSSKTRIEVTSLNYETDEHLAYSGANEVLSSISKTGAGPLILLLNSNKSLPQLRRHFTTFTSNPVVSMPFPPGPTHNPNLSTLFTLNWERTAVQLSLEAFLFMSVVSFPKRIGYSRYSHIPLGNLGDDENTAVFDIGMMRMAEKNLALSWANVLPGRPDLGVDYTPTNDGGRFPLSLGEAKTFTDDEVWGDDNELVSPVVRKPGTYRSICVDVDIQDLAIAALTDTSESSTNITGPSSPTSVTGFNPADFNKGSAPLGDEMATSVSLPMLRALVTTWLRDAFNANSLVADELLHHVYRLISSPDALMHDPALHRVVHALMKSAFLRLLAELQRLGCTVVHASFHRITVATNKLQLEDAEEFIEFVISTARNRAASESDHGDALSKISLRPRQFHSNFIFLDEYNYGTMLLERVPSGSVEEEGNIILKRDEESAVVATVLSAWSIMDYFGNEMAQEYFRIIIGRFSKDPMKKQIEFLESFNGLPIAGMGESDAALLEYRKKMVSKNFAAYLTRAASEIAEEGYDEKTIPRHISAHFKPVSPVLEFIKSVSKVLELDSELDKEVQVLKRSLLAQVGVAEYSKQAKWKNPAPTLILPDVFCVECHERRDLNLFYLPPHDVDETIDSRWSCEDCGSYYDVQSIEKRLVTLTYRKVLRYQLQDTRCRKTKRVSTRILTALTESSSGLTLDVDGSEIWHELSMLNNLAKFHELTNLEDLTESLLCQFH